MRILSVAVLVAAIVLGGLAYQQHGRYKELDVQVLSPNPDGTVSVQLLGPDALKAKKAKYVRNALAVGGGVCGVLGVGLLAASLRRKKSD